MLSTGTFAISISLKICSTSFLVNKSDVVNQNTTKKFFLSEDKHETKANMESLHWLFF